MFFEVEIKNVDGIGSYSLVCINQSQIKTIIQLSNGKAKITLIDDSFSYISKISYECLVKQLTDNSKSWRLK